ncbi:MAG: tRNA (adenosine(37)-N6)-dimethylallyltransferase MiaA [Candidatus Margulisbacteria bacterium]|nr:tRNA (adenosine(37)-N6)-dimethylallyltransferase MiaA [Candidatus Margulisiibacteriota bacterium]
MHIILGQTAVGKTKYAIELAKKVSGEILSADSMQVYRGMDIGTAKSTKEERQDIPHHLIDIRDPDEEWTVSDFVKETEKLVPQIIARGKAPIIAGGTGLYLWALLEGFSFPIVPADPELRKRLGADPLEKLFAQLKEVDPQAAAKIHPNDKKRIVRGLEVYELTGKPISSFAIEGKVTSPRLKWNCKIIGLTLPREELYRRIEERVDRMLDKGLVNEVKGLLAKGYSRELSSMQALGYKETIDHLEGKYSYEEYVKYFKQKSRNFARRQMTWFKRFKDVAWETAP